MKILGVRIDNFSHEEILNKTREFLEDSKFHQIATVNPEFILKAQKDEDLRIILNRCDLNIADGIGIKFAFLKYGKILKRRMAGADLILDILRLAEKRDLSVFLAINSTGLSLFEEIKRSINKLFPTLRVEGADLNPKIAEKQKTITGYDIVLCNFGSPDQEKFINSIKNDTIKLAIGVGGSFDFLTGKVKRAPVFMRNLGFEWLWRLAKQPKRFIKILKSLLVFPVRVLINK